MRADRRRICFVCPACETKFSLTDLEANDELEAFRLIIAETLHVCPKCKTTMNIRSTHDCVDDPIAATKLVGIFYGLPCQDEVVRNARELVEAVRGKRVRDIVAIDVESVGRVAVRRVGFDDGSSIHFATSQGEPVVYKVTREPCQEE